MLKVFLLRPCFPVYKTAHPPLRSRKGFSDAGTLCIKGSLRWLFSQYTISLKNIEKRYGLKLIVYFFSFKKGRH